ncbi:DUF6387 family protein [Citrobacter koseri]|uniref:DUF6387 family protein n=1 Tax=Citrobacter koseri TaxID=545 RepID=UPI003891E432
MKASEVMKAVKTWFKVSNYDALQEITIKDLKREAFARLMLAKHDFDRELSDDDDCEARQRYLDYEAKILSGKPLLVSPSKDPAPTYGKDYPLRKAVENPLQNAKIYIKHITVADAAKYERQLREIKILRRMGRNEEGGVMPASEEIGQWRLTDIEMLHPHKPLYLELNIRRLTDEEVIEHMKRMLPEWRRTHGIPEPLTGTFRFGLGTVKKMINFRIIPMLDLLFWAKREEAKISYEQLSRLLYPNDSDVIRGGAQIKDTDKPFAEKVLTREFERMFNIYLSKNDSMINTKVAEAMKMNEKEEE